MAFSVSNLINWTANLIPTATQLNNGLTSNIRAAGGPRTTVIPASPVDEDMWFYPADTTNGVVWAFKYNSGSASAYKWECVDGGWIYVNVATDETTTSTTYVDLATTGPSFTIPRAGDWDVLVESDMYSATGGVVYLAAPKKGATATADADAAKVAGVVNAPGSTGSKSVRFTGMAASDVIKVQYRTTGGTAHFANRVLRVRPVRVS